MPTAPRVAFVVLAAGGSTRMGTSKPLLQFQGRSLVRRSIEAGRASGFDPIVVVVGADADRVRDELAGTPAAVALNADWQAGMAGSIREGLVRATCLAVGPFERLHIMQPLDCDVVPSSPESRTTSVFDSLDGVAIALCDQPFVDALVLRRLLDEFVRTGAAVVATGYGTDDVAGPPAIFRRPLFEELLALQGMDGARQIIARHRADAVIVFAPGAAVDVDSPADYARLLAMSASDAAGGGTIGL